MGSRVAVIVTQLFGLFLLNIFCCAFIKCESKASEVEACQQKLRKEERLGADLSAEFQLQEATVKQLREQADSQPTAPRGEMDEAVKAVDDLKRRLVDAEEEKQKALGQLLATEEMLKITKEEVCLIKFQRLLFLHRAIVCLRGSFMQSLHKH